MTAIQKLQAIQDRSLTTTEALAFFDELATVDLDFMLGKWKGSGLHTNHPMDGWLEIAGWYGKEFIDRDRVHPLLFLNQGDRVVKISPVLSGLELALRFPGLKNEALKPIFNLIISILKTEKSQARMRMLEHRGKISATMIYDCLPINDVFRKIDDNTLLGLMDFKKMQQPFFFILRRE